MHRPALALALLLALPLAACRDENDPPADPVSSATAAEPPAVAADPHDPMARAQAVEADVLEQKDAQDRAIEAQEN